VDEDQEGLHFEGQVEGPQGALLEEAVKLGEKVREVWEGRQVRGINGESPH
jgi:hypothetical protein